MKPINSRSDWLVKNEHIQRSRASSSTEVQSVRDVGVSALKSWYFGRTQKKGLLYVLFRFVII